MPEQITLAAPAKINLSLDITGIMDNGYHALESVFQTVSICDSITVSRNFSDEITVHSSNALIPNDNRNIAYKAAEKFAAYTGADISGVDIFIKKRIPMQAGLGGGSTDGAAVLKALNYLFMNNSVSDDTLCRIGAETGADVPFFIKGGIAFAEGIGDKLTPLNPLPKLWLVIAKGKSGISTVEAYKKIDTIKNIKHPDTKKILTAIESGNLNALFKECANVFELAADLDDIGVIKSVMLAEHAQCALMTGSGSAVFGIFPTRKHADYCCRRLKGIMPYAAVCSTI